MKNIPPKYTEPPSLQEVRIAAENTALREENKRLKSRLTALEATQTWREIEKEKPPRGDLDVRYSVEVEVRLMLKWGDVEGGWEKGFCRWDYAMNDWDSLRRWTHWKPLSDNPEVVSDSCTIST